MNNQVEHSDFPEYAVSDCQNDNPTAVVSMAAATIEFGPDAIVSARRMGERLGLSERGDKRLDRDPNLENPLAFVAGKYGLEKSRITIATRPGWWAAMTFDLPERTDFYTAYGLLLAALRPCISLNRLSAFTAKASEVCGWSRSAESERQASDQSAIKSEESDQRNSGIPIGSPTDFTDVVDAVSRVHCRKRLAGSQEADACDLENLSDLASRVCRAASSENAKPIFSFRESALPESDCPIFPASTTERPGIGKSNFLKRPDRLGEIRHEVPIKSVTAISGIRKSGRPISTNRHRRFLVGTPGKPLSPKAVSGSSFHCSHWSHCPRERVPLLITPNARLPCLYEISASL